MSEEAPKVDQKASLYQKVVEKVDEARAKVEELREKLKNFDATSEGREKASAYFSLALDKTQEALAELTKQAQALKDNATEIPVRAFSNAFAQANEALTDVKERAKAFDEQHQLTSTVSEIINHPRDQAAVAIASASSYVAEAAHSAYAQLQGVSDGIKCRVMAAAEQGLEKVIPVVAGCDEKLGISERSVAAKDVVTQQVKAFDEKYHVYDKIVDLDKRWALSSHFASALSSLGQLDQKFTGGKVEPAVNSAYVIGLQMTGYIRDKYEECKQKGEGPAAEGEEAAAAPAPVVVPGEAPSLKVPQDAPADGAPANEAPANGGPTEVSKAEKA